MDLGSLLRDTKFMIIALVSDICADISAISGIFLLAWRFGGIGGLDKYKILFEVDVTHTPIRLLLKQLSESDGVKDVEISKAPIEKVIAGLYAAWK